MTDGSQYSNKSFVIIITTMLKNNIYIVKDRINKVFPLHFKSVLHFHHTVLLGLYLSVWFVN